MFTLYPWYLKNKTNLSLASKIVLKSSREAGVGGVCGWGYRQEPILILKGHVVNWANLVSNIAVWESFEIF